MRTHPPRRVDARIGRSGARSERQIRRGLETSALRLIPAILVFAFLGRKRGGEESAEPISNGQECCRNDLYEEQPGTRISVQRILLELPAVTVASRHAIQ